MSDLVTLIEKFGLKGIGLTILGGSVVWGLAHWTAAAGQPVSVLWGLVEYTKPATATATAAPTMPLAQQNAPVVPSPKADTPAPQPLAPLDPFVRHGLKPMDAHALRVRLRSDRVLRSLSTAEDGKNISEIPSGTYFYTLGAWLGNSPPTIITTEPFDRRLEALEASAEDLGPTWIELHRLNGGNTELLGCTDEGSAARAAHLTGRHEIEVTLSPRCGALPHTSMLSIPIHRIVRARSRFVRTSVSQQVLVDAVLR